jgi:hypothetical protein
MSVHATESKPLTAGLTRLIKVVVSKLSIITVIVLDAGTLLGGKLLKCLLGKDGLSSKVNNWDVHKTQLGVVVLKNSAVSVPLLDD